MIRKFFYILENWYMDVLTKAYIKEIIRRNKKMGIKINNRIQGIRFISKNQKRVNFGYDIRFL